MAKSSNKKNLIGLSSRNSKELSEALNQLLANYQVFYINARAFHWNVKGEKFFELHAKFEELYNDSLVKIDEIAERILTLGYTPYHRFTDFLNHATVKEAPGTSDGEQMVTLVVEGLQELLKTERPILKLAEESEDEGTHSQISDYIREQEKLVWMYGAYLSA